MGVTNDQGLGRKHALHGVIADLPHVRTEHCLSDCLSKKIANTQPPHFSSKWVTLSRSMLERGS